MSKIKEAETYKAAARELLDNPDGWTYQFDGNRGGEPVFSFSPPKDDVRAASGYRANSFLATLLEPLRDPDVSMIEWNEEVHALSLAVKAEIISRSLDFHVGQMNSTGERVG